MTKNVEATVGAVLLVLVGGIAISALTGPVAPVLMTKGVQSVKGEYYQVTADYTYKGEPVQLRFALTCSGAVTTYKYGDKSFDIFSGPVAYGIRLPDNKALALDTGYCSSISPNEPNAGILEDMLPQTFLFDDPDTLNSGVFFASDEAYDRPNSELRFGSIRFKRLTETDYRQLQKTQKPNVFRTPFAINQFIAANSRDLRYQIAYPGKRPSIARECYGWKRLPVPEAAREELRRHWPAHHPRYWTPADVRGAGRPLAAFVAHHIKDKNGRPLFNYGLLQGTSGVLRMDGTGHGIENDNPGSHGPRAPGSMYPQFFSAPFYPEYHLTRQVWKESEGRWDPEIRHVDIAAGDETQRGLLRCNPPAEIDRLAQEPARKPHRHDGHILGQSYWSLWNRSYFLTVAGVPVENCKGPPNFFCDFFFEDDAYYFSRVDKGLSVDGEQHDDN